MTDTRPRVLAVDDEPRVLSGMALHLRRRFIFESTTSPEQALRRLDEDGPYAVLLTDLHMPVMNGLELVRRARKASPHTRRLVISGNLSAADLVSAVNEGGVQHVLPKPYRPTQLLSAVGDAAAGYAGVQAAIEAEWTSIQNLLELLAEVMAHTRPTTAAQIVRVRRLAGSLAELVGVRAGLVDAAVIAGRLDRLLVERTVSDKLAGVMPLDRDESKRLEAAHEAVRSRLAKVGALRPVNDALQRIRHRRLARSPGDGDGHLLANVVAIAQDYDELLTAGGCPTLALDTMLGRHQVYDFEVMRCFSTLASHESSGLVRELPLIALQPGMRFAEDIYIDSGVLLVNAGQPVTTAFLARSHNFSGGRIREPIRIWVDEEAP